MWQYVALYLYGTGGECSNLLFGVDSSAGLLVGFCHGLGLLCLCRHLVAQGAHGVDLLLQLGREERSELHEVGHGRCDGLAIGVCYDAAIGERLQGEVGLEVGEERAACFLESLLFLLFGIEGLFLTGGTTDMTLDFCARGLHGLQIGEQLAHTTVIVAETAAVFHK